MRFGDSGLVRAKNNFGFLVINVETSQQQDQPREGRVTRDRFEPIIFKTLIRPNMDQRRLSRTIETKEDHLRLCSPLQRGQDNATMVKKKKKIPISNPQISPSSCKLGKVIEARFL